MNRDDYRRGIALFNRGRFFDAHEVLEDVWRASSGPEKAFLQGLIQLAVGLHHYTTGNLAGARSVVARGKRRLGHYPGEYASIDVAALRAAVTQWEDSVEVGATKPPVPRIRFVDEGRC